MRQLYLAVLTSVAILFTAGPADAASGGSLTATVSTPNTVQNLTSIGVTDWVHWGLNGSQSIDRAAAVTPQINNFTVVGGIPISSFSDNGIGFSWSNGTPTSSVQTNTGVYVLGQNNGFTFTAPADTGQRTLTVYTGVYKAQLKFSASLSDGSAPTYTDTSVVNASGSTAVAYVLTYTAASAGQTLAVSITQAPTLSDPGGNVTLAAVALNSTVPVPPDFSLAAPATTAISSNSTSTANITIGALSGFSGAVQLTAAGLPPNITASFNPASAHAGTSVLTFTAGSNASGGSFPITITGTSGTLTHETMTTLVVSGPIISGTVSTPMATVDLTAMGTEDWVHWGITSNDSIDRLAGVTPQVSSFTVVGYNPSTHYYNNPFGFNWTNGTPTPTASQTNTGVFVVGYKNGYAFTVPADPSPRTVTLYAGVYKGQAQVVAQLSDDSAPPYVDTSLTNVAGVSVQAYTITYKAGTAGQSLLITLTQLSTNPDPYSNVSLQAVTLQGASAPPFTVGGMIEGADCSTIHGWAWDSTQPNTPIHLDVLSDGVVVATVLANGNRPDLVGVAGNGVHGFSIPTPAALSDGHTHVITVRETGTGAYVASAPVLTCASSHSYGGFVDSASCDTIQGWAWDGTQPNTPISVDILSDGVVVATVQANGLRPDLVGVAGNGQHGFSATTPANLRDGKSHTITAQPTGSTFLLTGSPSITCSGAAAYAGFLDAADCSTIRGWGWDSTQPNAPINVDILADGTLVTTVLANALRGDLVGLAGNGQHGFSLPTPASLRDGAMHTIMARPNGATTNLNNTASLSCSTTPAYAGYLDAADCATIQGWAWNSAQPNTPVNVDILSDGVVVGTVPANGARPDLAGLAGNGQHGFSFPTPASVRDGHAHVITAQVSGTPAKLTNSKNVTCSGTAAYSGFVDSADCNLIRGWAWDANQPNSPVTVDILADGAVIATVPANVLRPDLVGPAGNGQHSFSVATPSTLRNQINHTITARVTGTATALTGAPVLNCSAGNFNGYLDVANCSTIQGWAWDATEPNAPINVDLYANGALVTTVFANQQRSDLVGLAGNGQHGFSIATPASLKNNAQQMIQAVVSGSPVYLHNTGTFTCAP